MSKKLVKITEVMLAVLLAVCGAFACAKMLFNNNAVASADENDEVATIATNAFDGGLGTEASPYLISSTTALNYFLNGADTYSGDYYSLTTDLTYSSTFTTKKFGGYFNGNNHTITMTSVAVTTSKPALFSVMYNEFKNVKFAISSYSMNAGSSSNVGFLTQKNNGTISNVVITISNNVTVGASNYFGFVATENTSTISSVKVTAEIYSSVAPTYLGGLVAYNTGSMTGCTSNVEINIWGSNDESIVGGICGYTSGKLTSCNGYKDINVFSDASYYCVGGLVGRVSSASKLSSCNFYGELYIADGADVDHSGTSYGKLY